MKSREDICMPSSHKSHTPIRRVCMNSETESARLILASIGWLIGLYRFLLPAEYLDVERSKGIRVKLFFDRYLFREEQLPAGKDLVEEPSRYEELGVPW